MYKLLMVIFCLLSCGSNTMKKKVNQKRQIINFLKQIENYLLPCLVCNVKNPKIYNS